MSAISFIAGRLANALSLIVAVLLFSFLLMHLAPGDPALVIAGESADATTLQEVRRLYGFDQPLLQQMTTYLWRVAHGDLGQSYFFNAPVAQLVMERVPATLLLVGSAITIAVLLGTSLGVAAACRPRGLTNAGITVLSVVGFAAPVFWTGIVLVQIFASHWPVFPVNGMRDVTRPPTSALSGALDVLHHLVLPTVSLAFFYLAQYSRLSRATMLEVLNADYIRTARSKGLPERLVIFRHGLRNAILPVLTVLGLQVGQLFAGAVLVEAVFNWPGLGTLAFDAILQRDTPVLLGILLFSAVIVVLTNMVIDVLYRLIDPRMGSGMKGKTS
ncbi:ABC transporter permease [Variovorax sp. PAMC 28711]|uniref:ABC transporter permease n=1 Tax=Variovorax sp. PAMC 28711 TaxID=1795631 RepID=UPI00078B58AA|nr:ABC transporter permease [Variovorax sp. PAMC 28711]AMM26905.1 ABC transporter permease [Variovorax sp. PAMC 28711]